MTQPLADTFGPATAVQALAACINLSPDMNAKDLSERLDKELKEIKELDTETEQNALLALEGVDEHLATVREHTKQWDALVERFFRVAADVKKIGADSCTSAQALLKQIADADTNASPEKQEELLHSAATRLTVVKAIVDGRTTNAQDLAKALADLATASKDDGTTFEKDRALVDKAIASKGSVIDSINQQVVKLNQQLVDDSSKIAKGKLGATPLIGLLVVGSVLTIAGQAFAAVACVTGGLAAQPTTNGVTVSGTKCEDAKGQLAKLLAELSLLQACISTFHTVQDSITKFVASITACAAGADNLHKAFPAYSKALETEIANVKNAASGSSANLSKALQDLKTFLGSIDVAWKENEQSAETGRLALHGTQTNVDGNTYLDKNEKA
ncbi:hypothetical protein V2E29_21390 [Streptomyces diastatochromogenes]|uniref:hypothetical protein n=1 Tax=Streptomyces diastatochromogenes TaxID=42236 RepID=UPI002F263914